jgi:hypothetical protein
MFKTAIRISVIAVYDKLTRNRHENNCNDENFLSSKVIS